jgi:hypothetical protein
MRLWRRKKRSKRRVSDLTLLEVEERLSRMFAASSFGCTTRLMFAGDDLHVVRLDAETYAYRKVDLRGSAPSWGSWRIGNYMELLQYLRSLGPVHEEAK